MNGYTDGCRDGLNEIEAKILKYITESIRTDGYSPSVRDIQRSLGIKSTSTAQLYINRLEEKGYITKANCKSRSIRLNEEMLPFGRVPILGRITAGMPILATENFEGYINFAAETVHCRPEDLFALRVSGESMREAGIMDGDIVIVEKTPYAQNGQIVVAMIDDSATVKTFYRENGHFRLQPENHTMQPIIADDVSVLGRVVASMRTY
ncbi:MAG: transcriptional repressor LexA [Clostridia bacterium]|nr:transcriptional repressor LexA [Clostridia bacterium]MDY3784552.1 transcriptional repressor LexA [Eubacteriales bacterium]